MISAAQLLAIMPHAATPQTYAPLLADAMDRFRINTPQRVAMFVAQIAHESGELRYVRELASGTAYEGRLDLGNDHPGDGVLYKGRGLIQITGKANYRRCGEGLGLPLVARPELLEVPQNAAASAAWFWFDRTLNRYADTDYFGACTQSINGRFNGLDARIGYWLRARKVLGL